MIKSDFHLLITLICRCIFVFFSLCILGSAAGSILAYFKIGYFSFDWKEAVFLSSKKGGAAGSVLGIGIWIKCKLGSKKNGE